MATRKVNNPKEDEKSRQTKDEAEGSGQNSEMILRMSSLGLDTEKMAHICNIEPAEVVKILEATEVSKTAQDTQSSPSLVKRLMTDPEGLCCPISKQLMEDPVVAGDGFTYERSTVEALFKHNGCSPMTRQPFTTRVLHQNQMVKSEIVSFKEQIVTEILCVAPKLPSNQSSQMLDLVQRGEEFVRPLWPDTSARKKLAALLLLKMKLPGERGAILGELVSLMVEIQDDDQLQSFLGVVQLSELVNLLPTLQEEMVESLHRIAKSSGVFKECIAQHFASRLASRLGTATRLKKLWQLVFSNFKDGEFTEVVWAQASGILLAAFPDRLRHSVPLNVSDVDGQILLYARAFAEDQSHAISFAKSFFEYDLGISCAGHWPPEEGAMIFFELCTRLFAEDEDENCQEKLELLLKAHAIDNSNASIRQRLREELQQCLLRTETPGAGGSINVEGLLLQHYLVEDDEVPADVLHKLTLGETELKDLSAEQLCLLSEQLKVSRRDDAARLAVKGAQLFADEGRNSESQDAFLQAFRCDHSNDDAADGMVKAILDMKEDLEAKTEQIEKLSAQCQALHRRSLELCVPMTFLWDLSGYDFSRFQKGQSQNSDTFSLNGFNTNAWFTFYPKGSWASSDGWAGCFLNVDKDVRVNATFGIPGNEWLQELDHDFATSSREKDGAPSRRGFANFIELSECEPLTFITLRILAIQSSGSSVRMVAPGSS